MRRLREPFEGYTRDKEQLFYWRMNGSSSTVENSANPFPNHSGVLPRHLLPPSGNIPEAVPGIFNTNDLTGGRLFIANNQDWLTANGVVAGQPQDHVYFSTSWSLAFWYDLSSAATQTIIEYGGPSKTTPLSVRYSGANRFTVTYNVPGTASVKNINVDGLPAKGWIGFVCERSAEAQSGSGVLNVYSSAVNGGLWDSLTAASLPPMGADSVATIGSSSSCHWIVGGSYRGGISDYSPRFFTDGVLDEMAFYPVALPPPRMRAMYASCVRDFDEGTLYALNQAQARVKVLIEDNTSGGTNGFTDLSQYFDVEVGQSVTITENIDDNVARADVRLRRTVGVLMNLNPAVAGQSLTPTDGLIDHRKRIRIERAVYPGERPQGWEWETRFEGFIDAYEFPDEHTIRLTCIDKAAPLIDAQVMEPRSLTYYTDPEAMEEVQQNIIDVYTPKLDRNTIVGYKAGTPKVYTPAGSSHTPLIDGVGWNINFQDVTSGNVWTAVQDLADAIGQGTRWRYYAPLGHHRLETYQIRRNLSLAAASFEATSSTGQFTVRFNEPHGLNAYRRLEAATLGQSVDVESTTNFNGGARILGTPDEYTLLLEDPTDPSPIIPTTATETSGNVLYNEHYALSEAMPRSITPVRSEVADIRNYAVVRYLRTDSTATLTPVSVTSTVGDSQRVRVTLPSIQTIDPDNNGFEFTLHPTGTSPGTSAPMLATFTGLMVSATEVLSNEPAPGLSGNFTMPAGAAVFSSPAIKFNEARSAYTPSITQYGLRPCAVFEGSTGAVSTEAEAQVLADHVVSDLAYPPIDYTLSTNILPLELGDLLAMANRTDGMSTKGMLNSPVVSTNVNAVVSITEKYESGSCYAEYGMRRARPVKGSRWGRRLITGGLRENLPNPGLIPDSVAERIKVVSRGRGIGYSFPNFEEGKASLRNQRIEMHAAPDFDFLPNDDTLVYRGNSQFGVIDTFANGTRLTPGETYHLRYRTVDKFGSVGVSSGLNAASAATVPSVRVRYLDEGLSSMRVTGGGGLADLTDSAATGFHFPSTHTGDPAGFAHLRFCTYASSRGFGGGLPAHQAPVSGYYRTSIRGTITDTKPGGTIRAIYRSWENDTSSTALFTSATFESGVIAGSGQVARFNFSDTLWCQSGSWVSWSAWGTGTNGVQIVQCSTACTSYASVEFQLISER